MEALKIIGIVKGKKLFGGMVIIKTEPNNPEVVLVGTNSISCRIPFKDIEKFILTLERECIDTGVTYQLELGNKVMNLPGAKVSKLVDHLRQVRDAGVSQALFVRAF